MNSALLDLLACPICSSTMFKSAVLDGSPSDVRTGIVWCDNGDWFPIEHRVLEFLPRELRYQKDRANFRNNHARELEGLGLLERDAGSGDRRTVRDVNLIQVQQQHFDWYAENDRQAYDSYAAMPFWRVVDGKTFSAWNARIRADLQAAPGDPKLLLDVGCAQGRSASMVAQRGLHVIGFDISKRMVRQAYQNFEGLSTAGIWNDFIVGDGSHFPFRSGIFDYALVYGVLHHLPDPATSCREIARVLKSGGMYFGSENNRTIFRRVFDLIQQMMPIWHEEAGAQPLIGSSDVNRWFGGTGLSVKTSATVFVPPHLVNVLGVKIGGFVLSAGDAILATIPYVKGQGGLIVIEGTKSQEM
jgi:ubiquinone/menaquinone biosynthesis C-methylase UbiE/uncharacterized protein YbaR (Trm112 family)